MPLQNRVTPFGAIVADPARGAWMGNRGCLHDDRKRLVRQSCAEKRWIVCQLSFKGRRRALMTPNHYTELFFLDEATALAAGHRPCAECRRADYRCYRTRFAEATGHPERLKAEEMDAVLHEERLRPLGDASRLVTLDRVPDGALVARPDSPGKAFLVLGRALRPWSFEGYGAPGDAGPGELVLITPPASAAVLALGYKPQIHESASDVR